MNAPAPRRLHVLVAAPPTVRVPSDLASVAAVADLIELRLDLLLENGAHGVAETAIAPWIAASPRPVLATVRSRAQGGAFPGAPAEAARLLAAAAAAGAAWIDAEAEVCPLLGALPAGVRVVASAHGPDAVAADVPADRHKVARPVEDAAAWVALAALPRSADTTVVPYGALGALRTALEPGLLYGAADERGAVVAGQPPLTVLLDELRAGEVGPDAALFGLVGEPPSRSPSPALHNAVFRAQGRGALYVPLPGLDLERALALPFGGFSVTHPFKQAAADAAASLDDDARRAGAVNTLVRRADGAWHGANTDAPGLRGLLEPADAGASAFVYGSGGFARSAAVALTDLGYAVRLGARNATYERDPRDAVLVNATPSGADGGPLPWLASGSLDGLTVVDAPYAADGMRTGLAQRAADDGAARLVDGHALLIAQARFQAALFAGDDELPGAVERVLTWARMPPPSLLLLGARGAGKTSVGRLVARRCGRPFLDLDEEVGRVTGRTPAAWIQGEGWGRFRDVEAAVLERALARRGAVIATGGGVVEHEASRALLATAGCRVHLALPPSSAAARVAGDTAVRPRWPGTASEVEEAEVLMARRSPAWAALAHFEVDAEQPIDDVTRDVVRCWGEVETEFS